MSEIKKQKQPNLDDLVKDKIKKDANKEANVQRCKECHKITFPPELKQCFGHAGGGGGGGGGDEKQKAAPEGLVLKPRRDQAPGQAVESSMQILDDDVKNTRDNRELELTPDRDLEKDKEFDPELISELLFNELLKIDNDLDSGTLTIALVKMLQLNPKLLSEYERAELQKYMRAILQELEKFKQEKGIKGREPEVVKNGEDIVSLRITLPTPELYVEFIQRLAKQLLLPQQNVNQSKPHEKISYPKDTNLFSMTPFGTRLTPNAAPKVLEEENKHAKHTRPKTILDGLKPKGT